MIRTDELKKLSSTLLSCCAKETSFSKESDALKILLARVEVRFPWVHTVLVEAINAHTAATNEDECVEELWKEVRELHGNVDEFFTLCVNN